MELDDTDSLAQKSSWSFGKSKSHSSGKNKEGGEFFTGVILIGLALPAVWMNERKLVKIY
jgi:hypothetical protein